MQVHNWTKIITSVDNELRVSYSDVTDKNLNGFPLESRKLSNNFATFGSSVAKIFSISIATYCTD